MQSQGEGSSENRTTSQTESAAPGEAPATPVTVSEPSAAGPSEQAAAAASPPPAGAGPEAAKSAPAAADAPKPTDAPKPADSPAAAAPRPVESGPPRSRRPLLTYAILGGAGGLALWASLVLLPRPPAGTVSLPVPPPKPPQVLMPVPARPQVDVVFVLDTTGSMSALIDGAKRKIWEIARFIAQGRPAPELRIGLVAYRDVGDEYVTRFFDLTDDLDGVYQNLSAFHAGGGGDTPEHVAKALHDAVYRSSWSSNRNALKLVYLVGDAPPHTDYNDGFNHRSIAEHARSQGIVINTVRCGSDENTRLAWLDIASRAGGDFSSVEQSGGMVETSTPYDGELARLNRALTETAVPYGSAEKRARAVSKAKHSLEAPAAAQAERAGWFGLLGSRGRNAAVSEGDLLDDVANKRVDLSRLEGSELPEDLQGLPAAERKAALDKKGSERSSILGQINDMSAKRDAYLRSKAAAAPAKGFDHSVRSTVKKQAEAVGLAY